MPLYDKAMPIGGAAVSAAPTKQTVVLPQKAQNRFTQKFIAEKILPQITQIYTEVMVL